MVTTIVVVRRKYARGHVASTSCQVGVHVRVRHVRVVHVQEISHSRSVGVET